MKDILPVWSLTDFYDSINSQQIKVDLEEWTDEAIRLQKEYEGKIASLKGNELGNVIACFERIISGIGKIKSHADLCFASDTGNSDFAQHSQNMSEAVNTIQSKLIRSN